MMSFRSKEKFSHIVLAAMLGIAVVAGCAGTSARAQDDDEDNAFDAKIVRGILKAFGFRRDEEAIEYRERPPLVLPPGNTPPPPGPKAGMRSVRFCACVGTGAQLKLMWSPE